jgi:TRAP-type C4-dicarboxylate transport system permease small subunit
MPAHSRRFVLGAVAGGALGWVGYQMWDRTFQNQQAALRWEMLLIGLGVGAMLGMLTAAASLPGSTDD